MTISISGQVPAEAQNGMTALEAEWTKPATPDTVYAVVKIDRAKLHFDDDKQDWAATMKLSHIEPLSGVFEETAREMLRDSAAERGGAVQTELDIPKDDEPAAEMKVPEPQWADDEKPADAVR